MSAETEADRAERLFEEGFIHYQQHYSPRVLPKLKEAAAMGHVEAAYYAGEIIRQRSVMNPRAVAYYRQAAEGGDVYAMLRLSREDAFCGTVRDCDPEEQAQWLEQAEEVALARANVGGTEAMLALFFICWQLDERDDAVEWARKAADGGHRFAQYWLGEGIIDEGVGFYWTKAGRQQDVIKWLRASAENGFPKAMLKLALSLREQGDLEEARYWIEKMAETDHYDSLLEAGFAIMFGPDVNKFYGKEAGFETDADYGFPEPRPVEGMALLLALHRETGKETSIRMVRKYQDDLSPEILEAAEERSKELLVDTPILYYDPKFGL